MAQHDYVIANGTGAAVRSDLNNALAAIVSQNSGATEPTTTYAYQFWADTTTNLLKIRNAANSDWITLRELDGTLTIEDGTVSAPGLAFADDLNTGIYSPGADEFAVTTNGVERVEFGTTEVVFNDGGENYDFRVEGDTEANLFFVDASADTVSFRDDVYIDSSGRLLAGTSTTITLGPANNLIQSHSTSRGVFGGAYYGDDALGLILVLGKSRGTTVGTYNAVNDNDLLASIIFAAADGTDLNSQAAAIRAEIDAPPGANDTAGRIVFATTADGASTPTDQVTIDRNGNVGIGRYPTEKLDVYKASGRTVVEVDSDSLADGESSGFSFAGGSRNGIIGIYKHSGITDPCAYIHLDPEDGTNNYLWVDNSNVLRITTSLANVGTTGGTVVGTQSSDERIKNILGPVEYGLDTLKQIEPVRYSLKSEPETEKIGFIAQQVQPLVPESVYDTGDHIEGEPEDAPTMLAMEYVALVPVLINAVKELSAEVDALKAQLQAS